MRGGTPKFRRVANAVIDRLETRRMLAAADPGGWDLVGTDAGDVITISLRASDNRLLATMNGQVVGTRLVRGLKYIAISGGAGNDVITLDLHDDAQTFGVWVNGGQGRDRVVGSPGDDLLIGGSGRDVLDGAKGDDQLRGGTDRDELIGGDGEDYLQGNAGNDTLAGGWGRDTLTGATGADQLRGGDDDDVLVGGKDNDTLKGGQGADDLQGGAAANMFFTQSGVDQAIEMGASDALAPEDISEPLERIETDDALKSWLIGRAVEQWKWAFGQKIAPYQWYEGRVMYATTSAGLVSALDSATAAPDASTTNVQEQGVDEADLIETDGDHLYLLDGTDLVIADAVPAGEMKIVSRTHLDGSPHGLYLDNGRVTVVSQLGGYGGILYGGAILVDATWTTRPQPAELTKPQVKVTVFDVADPAEPAVVENTAVDGWLQDSRMIDGRLYLVVQNYLSAPAPKTIKNDAGDESYESESSYRAHIADEIDDLIPRFTATPGGGGAMKEGALLAAPDVYVRAGPQLDMTTVALIDTRDAVADVTATTSVLGAQGQVYASPDSLYLSSGSWSTGNRTDIVKFGLGIDQVPLEATGSVDGYTFDPFSMSEKGEFFRIATTVATSNGGQSSGVTVLDQVGDDLTQIGHVGGLGNGERMQSARFVDDRAYVVTFRQVDPLFVVDLSEPTAPKVAGELKIPGFSSYLHPVDETHLIGLGYDADDSGRTTAMQVSLFDVADPAKPTRVDAYTFADGSYTQAASDYHAFSYFPEQHVLAIPFNDYTVAGVGSTLEVLKVDVANGFTHLGSVSAKSQVLRSVRIGNVLYALSIDAVTAHPLDDVTKELGSIDLSD